MYRVTNGFENQSLPDFSAKSGSIIAAMEGNTNFPLQQSLVDELKVEEQIFTPLMKKAMSDGGKEVILARDASRVRMIDKLHRLGFDVTAVADGNQFMLQSSGFSYTTDKQPTPPLVAPEAPKVLLGTNKGELVVKAKKQKGVKAVTYFISPNAAEGNWQSYPSTTSKFVFTDLQHAHQYSVKYAPTGVRNQVVTSSVSTYVTQ